MSEVLLGMATAPVDRTTVQVKPDPAIDPATGEEQEIEIEFTFADMPTWYRTHVAVKSYTEIMNSGMIEGRMISAVRLWVASTVGIVDCGLIYDFRMAKSGKQPFRNADS